ncbi:MAG TPA: M13 family metallopeptidase [Terriglobales bacterium]|jgi:putative endopeptidase|nr:M13 family metallopeptidase [Terriglobales bacterium]
MRLLNPVTVVALFSMALFAADDSALRGVYVGDIDKSVNPCVNFFDYANGAWRKQNPIPPSMVRWSRRWESGETNKDVLHGILEETAKQSEKTKPGSTDQLVSDYYGACMDEKAIEQRGIEPIRPDLNLIKSMKSRADLQKVITHLNEEALFAPFAFGSNPDRHEPTNVIADFEASGLGLPDRDYYFKDDEKSKETRQKYLEHVAMVFQLAGSNAAEANATAQTVMKMETALAGASLTNVELRDPKATDHKMTVADAQMLSPNLQWQRYFSDLKVDSKVPFNVGEPKFLAEVDRQLANTPIADWKTYLTWHVLRTASPYLSSKFVDEDFAFNQKYLNGAQEMKPLWKRCAESEDSLLGEALGKKYVEKVFPPEAKTRVQEIVKNILAALHDDIEQLTWMSPETKQKALLKLSTFNPKIGYPDKWKDYSSVKITRTSYMGNVIEASKFLVRDDLDLIGKPIDRGRWGMTPPTSNAYYNPLLNEIVFPAGILVPPLFDVKANDAVNYGSIGPIIGHEISHGFDDQGAQFDEVGRLHDWWTPADYRTFQTRAQCVVDQFNSYSIEGGMHHNGKLVLGESIGDLGGLRLGYLALEKSMEGKPRPENVDGFTPEQQYFIAWGQARGDEIRPETQRQMVLTDPHPIGKYRVIGPMSNMPEFQKAFSCKESDPMVRPADQRCAIW